MTEVSDEKQNEEESVNETIVHPEKAKTLYDIFERDENLEKTGIPIDYGPAGTFLVARAGGSNEEFSKELDKRLKPYRALMDQDQMDNEVAKKIMVEVWVDTILKGWIKVRGRDGKELVFNRANAIKLLMDLPELFTDIREQSSKGSHYRKESTDIAAGN